MIYSQKQLFADVLESSCKKELRNCILCIICVWSLFCTIRVYTSQHFLRILLLKLGFRLSVFGFSCFYSFFGFWFFSFSVPCFEFIVILNDLCFNFVLTLFKWSVTVRIALKNMLPESSFIKKKTIYKERFYSVNLISIISFILELWYWHHTFIKHIRCLLLYLSKSWRLAATLQSLKVHAKTL